MNGYGAIAARTPERGHSSGDPMEFKPETPELAPHGELNRREFLHGVMAAAAVVALGGRHPSISIPSQKDAVIAQIAQQHNATVKMLQEWIALPSIAAENLGYPQGPEYMAKLARDAGFTHVEVIPTAGKSGVSIRSKGLKRSSKREPVHPAAGRVDHLVNDLDHAMRPRIDQ